MWYTIIYTRRDQYLQMDGFCVLRHAKDIIHVVEMLLVNDFYESRQKKKRKKWGPSHVCVCVCVCKTNIRIATEWVVALLYSRTSFGSYAHSIKSREMNGMMRWRGLEGVVVVRVSFENQVIFLIVWSDLNSITLGLVWRTFKLNFNGFKILLMTREQQQQQQYRLLVKTT